MWKAVPIHGLIDAYDIVFRNAYVPASFNPPVRKKVVDGNGSSVDVKDSFVFQMTPDMNGQPMPDGAGENAATVSVVGNGSGEFGVIHFTKPGTYSYSVSEIQTTDTADYIYDRNVGKYTFNVTRENPNAEAEKDGTLTIKRTGAAFGALTFTNVARNVQSVKPGDETPLGLYLVLMAAALAAVGTVLVISRKKREQ